ncbi:MAG: c-type cytochrome [Proteobacteria bacterium]|jgi:cytochrome c553|nr:c-type cytochrome [Pseudomonadota bacterium]
MKPAHLIAALALAALTGSAAAQAPDPHLARNLAATCANCHGTNGRAVPGSGMEALAGTDKAKLVEKFREYRAGIRPATVMHQIAKGYSDEQIELIAAYFAAQK